MAQVLGLGGGFLRFWGKFKHVFIGHMSCRKDTAEADPGWVESTLSIPAVPLQRNVISVGIGMLQARFVSGVHVSDGLWFGF